MGVVRDVTIDNLTQAVQGISSTGISDSTGQAINNTLGTLGKDISLQGIITAISGLGQTLGSDKANISGDNIPNPSAFRQNIGLNGTFYHDVKVASDTLNAYTGGNDIFNLPTPSVSANRYILLAWNSTLGQDMIICKFSNGQISCSKKTNKNDQVFIQGFIF